MESRSKRKNFRRDTGLIIFLFLLAAIAACSSPKKEIIGNQTPKPVILILPVQTRGPGLPDMMDLTESLVYLFKRGNKYEPLDAGESLAAVKNFNLKGIYPQKAQITQIGMVNKIDFLLIAQVISDNAVQNSFQLQSGPVNSAEVRLRLFNAKTGKLKQVIHLREEVVSSLQNTLNRILTQTISGL